MDLLVFELDTVLAEWLAREARIRGMARWQLAARLLREAMKRGDRSPPLTEAATQSEDGPTGLKRRPR